MEIYGNPLARRAPVMHRFRRGQKYSSTAVGLQYTVLNLVLQYNTYSRRYPEHSCVHSHMYTAVARPTKFSRFNSRKKSKAGVPGTHSCTPALLLFRLLNLLNLVGRATPGY